MFSFCSIKNTESDPGFSKFGCGNMNIVGPWARSGMKLGYGDILFK